MYLRILFVFPVLFCLVSCGSDNSSPWSKVEVNLDKSSSMLLSDFFESIDYVLLEETESAPLANPYKILFIQDKIFVHDNTLDNLHVFDLYGHLLFILKSMGKGPNEFSHIRDFTVKGDSIVIKDDVIKKMIFYNIQGKYIGERKFQLNSHHFFHHPEFDLHYMNHEDEFDFIKVDQKGNVLDRYSPVPEHLQGMMFNSKEGFQWNRMRNKIFFNIPYSNNIAVFNTSGKISDIIEIDLGNDMISPIDLIRLKENFADKSEYIEENNLVEMVHCFFPFENGFFVFLIQGNKTRHYVWLDPEMKVKRQADNLKNDLDGMIIRTIPWAYSGDQVVFKVNSTNFLNDFREKEDEIRAKYPDSSILRFIDENEEQLQNEKTVLVMMKVSSDLIPS